MEADWRDLAQTIQSSALEPGLWPKALSAAARLFDAMAGGLFLHDVRSGACLLGESWNLDPSWMEQYADHYHSVDVLLHSAMRRPQGEVVCGHEVVPRQDYLKTEHYNDFWQPQDISDVFTVFPIKDDQHFCHFGFFYQKEFEDPGNTRRNMLTNLLPFVQTSLSVQLKLQAYGFRAASLEQAFEQLGLGVLLLSGRGKIQEVNQKAREILARGDGLVSAGQSLSAVKTSSQTVLSTVIKALAGNKNDPALSHEFLIERISYKAPYRITILPISASTTETYPWAVYSQAAAIALIEDLEGPSAISHEGLQRLYGLSMAEARLATIFLETASLQESAVHLKITQGTARQYMKSIFRKTNTRSQVELMKLLAAQALHQ